MDSYLDDKLKDILDDLDSGDPRLNRVFNNLQTLSMADIPQKKAARLSRHLRYLIKSYEQEVKRLKDSISSDNVVTLIDSYNKGRLEDHISFIDDLMILLDESFRDD